MYFKMPYKPIQKIELRHVVGSGTVAEIEYPDGHPHFKINDTIVIATDNGKTRFTISGIENAYRTDSVVALILQRCENQETETRCPSCGLYAFEETCIGIIRGLDTNTCNCACGQRFYMYEVEK